MYYKNPLLEGFGGFEGFGRRGDLGRSGIPTFSNNSASGGIPKFDFDFDGKPIRRTVEVAALKNKKPIEQAIEVAASKNKKPIEQAIEVLPTTIKKVVKQLPKKKVDNTIYFKLAKGFIP